MKRKRKIIKNKAQKLKTISLDGIEVNCEEVNAVPVTHANEILLSEDHSKHIVNTLNAIDQRLATSENVWKLFFHKLLEIRTNLESQVQGSNNTIKYEIKYQTQPSESNSDSENTIEEESIFPILPIAAVVDFKHLNRICCANVELEQELQKYFLKLPSKHLSLRKWCETNLSKFLTDSVANQFSWNGSKLTTLIKEPVYNSKTIRILIDCAKIKYETSIRSDIEQCIRWWFARTSLRTALHNSHGPKMEQTIF